MQDNRTIKWPNGARCAVMYSFDYEGETIFQDKPEGKEWVWPRQESIGRYGPSRGIYHLLKMLKENDVKATFFTPAKTALDFPESIRAIVADGHEVGQHGYYHEDIFGSLPEKEQRELIESCQKVLIKIAGKPASGFRSPCGDYNTIKTAEILQDFGFSYSSSMRGDDRPYRTIINGQESDFIEIPAKWELDDYPFFIYSYFPVLPESQDRIAGYDAVLNNWKMEFDGYYKEGLCFVMMNHPLISGLPGRVQLHDQFIKYIKSFPDVWFATGSEIAQWWRTNY